MLQNNDIIIGLKEFAVLEEITPTPVMVGLSIMGMGLQLEGNDNIPCADLDYLVSELGEDKIFKPESCIE